SQIDDMIDTGHQVFEIAATPVLVVGIAECLAVTAAATRIAAKYCVAAGSEHRNWIGRDVGDEILCKYAAGTAMDHEQEWIRAALLIIHGIRQQTFDFQ